MARRLFRSRSTSSWRSSHMSPGPLSEDREARLQSLLKDVMEEPTGWSWLDLDRLLDLAGFNAKQLETAQGWPVRFRYHDKYPDLNVILFPVDRVHVSVAQRCVQIIQEARSRPQTWRK